eukprot:CAMPEP_0113712506 /NCGR_PEP_ID=MMETSP0038_2-20120614/31431_1 /TAXON_ID=2898 /ORGANISM="Cryptomonas paramecium" /LENGTH=187 /DNA_ID=CAMNT_0000639043 /DNA_START=354 /DNA_END=914 /DNA_ORIENTATION=- /assembly_acc=CAM_ASM_000170
MTGETMTKSEYDQIADEMVLRILPDGEKEDITLAEAVEEAEELDLDVVVVARTAKPMVVRLMDQGKEKHDRTRKLKDSAKKAQNNVLKELRVGLNIGQHDLDVKMRQARDFIEKGYKIKFCMLLRGKDFYNRQPEALQRTQEIADMLGTISTVESPAALLGRIVSVTIKPGAPKEAKPAQPAKGAPA